MSGVTKLIGMPILLPIYLTFLIQRFTSVCTKIKLSLSKFINEQSVITKLMFAVITLILILFKDFHFVKSLLVKNCNTLTTSSSCQDLKYLAIVCGVPLVFIFLELVIHAGHDCINRWSEKMKFCQIINWIPLAMIIGTSIIKLAMQLEKISWGLGIEIMIGLLSPLLLFLVWLIHEIFIHSFVEVPLVGTFFKTEGSVFH